jgi:hypothetical protein
MADWLKGCGSRNDSDAVNRRLLDSALRARVLGVLGKRTAYNSFQPTAEIRPEWCGHIGMQRGAHVRGASTCIQRMQTVLTQLHLKLANVSAI